MDGLCATLYALRRDGQLQFQTFSFFFVCRLKNDRILKVLCQEIQSATNWIFSESFSLRFFLLSQTNRLNSGGIYNCFTYFLNLLSDAACALMSHSVRRQKKQKWRNGATISEVWCYPIHLLFIHLRIFSKVWMLIMKFI